MAPRPPLSLIRRHSGSSLGTRAHRDASPFSGGLATTIFKKWNYMPYANLDDRFVRLADCPSDRKKVEYQDLDIRGFVLEVRESGLKTFAYRYRDRTGAQRQHRIGSYPNIPFEMARREAVRLDNAVAGYRYPAQAVWVRSGLPSPAKWQRLILERAMLDIADAFDVTADEVDVTLMRFAGLRVH